MSALTEEYKFTNSSLYKLSCDVTLINSINYYKSFVCGNVIIIKSN